MIKKGEKFTISGVRAKNRDRRWWQFWKPKYIDELQTFTVTEISNGKETTDNRTC